MIHYTYVVSVSIRTQVFFHGAKETPKEKPFCKDWWCARGRGRNVWWAFVPLSSHSSHTYFSLNHSQSAIKFVVIFIWEVTCNLERVIIDVIVIIGTKSNTLRVFLAVFQLFSLNIRNKITFYFLIKKYPTTHVVHR